MFNVEIDNRECLVIDGYTLIKELKCKLKRATKENAPDELEECITNMFLNSADNTADNDMVDSDCVAFGVRHTLSRYVMFLEGSLSHC